MSQQPSDESILSSQMEDCIQDCLNSHAVCLDTAMSLLQKGNHYADPVRILLDCSEVCATNAHFLMRNSPVSGSVLLPCAQVCNHCAGVCDEIGETDCANACRASATSSEQMAKLIP
jgi:hypothetical protein